MGIALITGATTGIGKDLAFIMAREGHDLYLVARSQDKLAEIQKQISAEYKKTVKILSCDLAQPRAGKKVFAWIQSEKVQLDFLINNAGVGWVGHFADADLEQQLHTIELNVTSLTELCGLFIPQMKKNGHGRVLNVASTAAFQAGPMMAVYYATKAYVLSFSEALARELESTGVTVTTLCPGPTETEFQQKAGIDLKHMFKGLPVSSSKQVAEDGYRAMMTGKVVKISGVVNAVLAQSSRFTPRFLSRELVFRMQQKRAAGN